MALSESDLRLSEQLEQKLARANRILENLLKETDRGCALVAGEFLNEKLLELLQARAIEEVTTDDRLSRFFAYEDPLGTFSARLKASYLFGFISKKVYRDIDYVRKIRN